MPLDTYLSVLLGWTGGRNYLSAQRLETSKASHSSLNYTKTIMFRNSMASYSCFLFCLVILLADSQVCPPYVENCQNCSAQVTSSGNVISLAQCQSCLGGTTSTHLTFYSNKSQGCQPCPYSCRSCLSEIQGQCSSCELSFYQSGSFCLPCSTDNCARCTSTTCQQCLDGYFLTTQYTCLSCSIYQNAQKCRQNVIVTCRMGYFVLDGQQCLPCMTGCLNCTSNLTCNQCTQGFYGQNCTKCMNNCVNCKSASICLQCSSGFYVNSALSCTQCLKTNCQVCLSNGNCQYCSSGMYVAADGSCQPAKTGISNCKYRNETQCIQCNDMYYSSKNGCQPCSILCQKCAGPHFASCSVCTNRSRYQNGQCIANRTINLNMAESQDYLTARNNPSKFKSDTGGSPAFICSQPVKLAIKLIQVEANLISAYKITIFYKIYLQAMSYKAQLNNSFGLQQSSIDNITRLQCQNYTVHTNSLSFNNISLNNTFIFLSDGIGISELLFSYSRCGRGCSTCLSSSQCITCFNNSQYRQLGQCVAKCSQSFYSYDMQCYRQCPNATYANDDIATCQPCPVTCSRCLSPQLCVTCKAQFYLINSTCQASCPTTYYANNQTNMCELCLYPCLTCNSSNYCLSCLVNFLTNGICVAQCPDTTYANLTTMQCQPCINNCKSCRTVNRCLSCVDNFYLFNQTCVSTCPERYYRNVSCQPCQYRCRTCTSLTYCTSCQAGYLYNGTCNNTCPVGTYGDISRLECRQCICPTCTALGCTSCQNGTYLINGKCLSSCPPTYYSANNTCQQCEYPCQLCSDATKCLSCREGYLRQDRCVRAEDCNNGSYADVSTRKCQPCNASCFTCRFRGDYCTSCQNSTIDVLSNRCVVECPAGQFNNNSATCQNCSSICLTCVQTMGNCTSCHAPWIMQGNTCVNQCTEGYYLNASCLRCDARCQKCSSATQCQSCSANYFLNMSIVGDVPCVSICQPGYYGDIDSRLCLACQPPCLTCNNTICMSCLNGYLLSGRCLSSCPTGTFILSATCSQCSDNCLTCQWEATRCLTCPSGLYMHNTSCVKQCPPKTYLSVKECVPCQYPCLTCLDSRCLSCVDKYLDGTVCTDVCSKNRYPSDGVCVPCVQPCLFCQTKEHCTSCIQSHYLESDRCVQVCKSGYFGDSGICQPCLYPCLECSTVNTCLSCQSGSLINGSCVGDCAVGTYKLYDALLKSDICRSCSSVCHTCINSPDYCIQCNDRRYSLNGSCYDVCPVGYYDNSVASVCSRCQQQCKRCKSQSICLECQNLYLLNSSCVRYCPRGYYEEDMACQLCVSPCVTCYNRLNCTSCQSSLLLYQQTCVRQCPQGSYLVLMNMTCQPCLFPCRVCSSYWMCDQCLKGYLEYRMPGRTICLDGPYCPNGLYVQQGKCVQQCSVDLFRQQQNRQCNSSCRLPYIHYMKQCVLSCPDGYYMDSKAVCQRGNMSFEPTLVWLHRNSTLFLVLYFTQPIRLLSTVGQVWLKIVSSARLLLQQDIRIYYHSNTGNTLVFQVEYQQTLLNVKLTIVFTNQMLLSILNRQDVPLQSRNVSTVIPYYQWYPADKVHLGFHYIGQILSGLVWTVAVAFMATSRLTQLYFLIDVMQQTYLLSYLEILYPPNIGQLLAGFKNSHLYFLPNVFSMMFDESYHEHNPWKFRQHCVDINFLRNSGHVYTLLLILAAFYGILRLVIWSLTKLSDKYPSCVEYAKTVEHYRFNYPYNYPTDIMVSIMLVTLFYAFSQMADYGTSSISRGAAALSLLTVIAMAFWIWRVSKKMMELYSAVGRCPKNYRKIRDSQPNIACLTGVMQPTVGFSPFLVGFVMLKKIIASACLGLMYSRPLFTISVLGTMSIISLILFIVLKPLQFYSGNIIMAASYSFQALFYLILAVMQFNYDTLDWKQKWAVGWIAMILIVSSICCLIVHTGYRILTAGYDKKSLKAQYDDESESEQAKKDGKQMESGTDMEVSRLKLISSMKQKPKKRKEQVLPTEQNQEMENQIISYDVVEKDAQQPKVLVRCYRYPTAQ